ncbi:MAG: tRNA pseudouridine(38-40) synthase TruA [Candidatus Protochlamydia sp.]|nr:tRNA pseudouridine(38-40) synthase TruA [Candidatus Protochlamydia sp.]
MNNIKLSLAYDGCRYRGWQKTPQGHSIEHSLQQVLEQILQHPVPLQAASRTDAGVHASGQVVNFFTSKNLEDFRSFTISLNRLLPKDITVHQAEKAPFSFHPTLDCKGKEYRYYLSYDFYQQPHQRFYEWHTPCRLELEEIKQAIPYLLGEQNFAAFCNLKIRTHYHNFIRQIESIVMEELPQNKMCFIVRGNHFLYKMVRNLVGSLVYVGRGRIKKEDLASILRSEKRAHAGITAPAHGLFLHSVFY